MSIHQLIKKAHSRLPWMGPVLWILTVQNFAAVIFTALGFVGGYSWTHNHVSDLGNTACGWFNGRFVCSPHHAMINLSYIGMGAVMILGALFIYQEFRSNNWVLTGFAGTAIAGLGAIIVGIFPENTIHWVHLTGAGFVLFIGNLAIVILGISLRTTQAPGWVKVYSIISGILSLTALGLLATDTYLGTGFGTLEHITTDLETIWLIVFGSHILASH